MAQDINIRIGANITDLQKKLGEAQKSLAKSGRKMQRLGSDLMMSLTAPLGIFGASIVSVAADFEKSMNAMKAVTNGGVESFDLLEQKAKELGATTQFSATQAAEAMEMLGRNGLNAAQILNGAADSSLSLAAATGTDLSNAANIATDAMAQFGIKATEMAGVSDLITGSTVNSKFSIDDFQFAMAQAGGVAGAVGVSFKDFATTVSAISPSFASGSDAGTSLKTMLTRLVPESEKASEKMRELGIITKEGSNQFFDAEGNIKSMSEIAGVLQNSFNGLSEAQTISAAKTIFGTDAMRAGLKLAEVGSGTFDNLAESISGVSAAEVAGIRLEGFSGAVLKLKSAFETLQLAIADAGVLDFATRMVQNLTALSLKMAALDPLSLKMAVGFAAIVAALGPAIFAFGTGAKLLASLSGHINIVVGMLGKMQAMINLVVVAETRSILLTRAKTTALKMYNATLALSNSFLNLFKVSTYKNIAATIAQTTATIATNAAIFAGVAIIQAGIAIETAYVAVKKLLTGQIKIATIAQKAFNLMLAANPIGIAIAAIMGLVAAFTFAYQNLDWFRKFVDNSLKFISDKFSWMLAKVKFVFKNFPAILKAGWAALKQFAANIKNKLKVLGMNAESFRLKFARALTIDKDKRAEFTKQINKIGTETKGIQENAKNIGDVFNETLSSEIKKVKNIKVPDLKMQAVTAAPSLSSATMPSANVATNTTGIKNTTAAITEQKTQVASLATELEGLNTFQAESSFLSNRMALSMNSLTTAQSAFSEKMETMKTAIADFNNGLTDLVNTGLSDLAAGLGEGLGAMAAGTGNLQTMAGSLLSTLGGMLMQLGKMAIQTGIAIFGIKKALQSLNPAVAIAGGIALVALAKMVSSKAAKISEAGSAKMPAFANGGFVTKPTLGLFGEKGPEAVIPKRRLDSLLSSAENGGGMGTLTTRISGSDLEIVLDKTKRKNNRIR